MQALKTIDQVAYVRFASVYRDFQDITEFETVLKPMLKKTAGRKPRPRPRETAKS